MANPRRTRLPDCAPRAEGDSDRDVYDYGRLRVEHDNYYMSCEGLHLDLRRAEFLLLSRLARDVSSAELKRQSA